MITVPARMQRPALAAVAGALVLGAAVLPGDPGPAGRLAELTGAADSRWADVLLALATVAALWRLPAVWPLAAVVVASPFVDAIGANACLAVASFAAAGGVRRPGGRAGYLLVSTVWAVSSTAVGSVLQEDAPGATLQGALGSALLFAWLPFALGLWLEARREVLAQARERAERLERDQQAAAERARARERARVAHDMHDVVAHRVSLMVLHAGGLEVNTTDPETAETAELIRATGVEALEQLREVLGLLRTAEPALTPSADLERLVADSVQAGVPVSLRCTGSLDEVPMPLARTVHRTVREALTNVHKHAGPATTTIEVDCTPERVALRVRNASPSQPVGALPGAGTGLEAVGEAVAMLGGTMTAGPRPGGGYELAVEVPRTVTAGDRRGP